MYQVWSNPLKDLDSRVFTRMCHGKKFDPVTLTFVLLEMVIDTFNYS
jgi:hypothetical protein